MGIALKNAPPGGTYASVRRWHCDGSEHNGMMLKQENGHR
jgi:hypothetical protein